MPAAEKRRITARVTVFIATAYASGCKGCTTYRPSAVRGAVLEVRNDRARPQAMESGAVIPAPIENPAEPSLPFPLPPPRPRHEGGVVYMTQPLDRPEVLLGQTYKIKWADSDHAFYITINDIQSDGRPCKRL